MFRYPIATVAVAVVVAIELLLRPLSVMRIPFLLFGTAVVAAALLFERLKSAAREAVGDPKRTVERLESIPDGFLALDHGFRVTYVNQAAEILMAKPKADLLGKSVWEVYPEPRGTIAAANCRRALAEYTPLHFEYRDSVLNKWFDVSICPSTGGGLSVSFREITGEKQAQAMVGENEEQYRFNLERTKKQVSDVLESITEMFIAVDREWRFTYANRPAVEKVGKPREEVLGKNIWELIPELTAKDFRSPFERVMTERVPIHFEFVGPRGTWLDVHAHPAEGGLSAYILDITERKKNEEELSRLAAVVDASDDAIMSLALDGTVLTWNGGAERTYGYSAQEMIGRNMSLVRPPDTMQEIEEKLAAVKRGESFRNFQAKRIRKDGRLIWISITASPIRDRRGEVVAISTTARDITEIKALAEELRQAAKLESLGVLAGGIAHDFNNLLVGILGNASLASDILPPTSPARPMLDGVVKASERAAMLTQQLLAYSGKGKFIIQPVDISDLAREIQAGPVIRS